MPRAAKEDKPREAFLPLWMPVVALAAPLVFAAWKAVSADSDAAGAFALALAWPGVALYLGAVAVLWAGWKIELE